MVQQFYFLVCTPKNWKQDLKSYLSTHVHSNITHNSWKVKATQGPSSQSYGFSSGHVWMWELDDKAEHQIIDTFELRCWRRLLRVPWSARRSNQSILKEISHWKDWYWSWYSNTLAIWCEEVTHLKDPDAGKDWRREKRATEDEMFGWHHPFNGHEFE